MKYYRVYCLDDNNYIVVPAFSEMEALQKAHFLRKGRLFAQETSSCDYVRSPFSVL